MKKRTAVLAILAFLLAAAGIYAQDLIALRDGNILEARILELSPAEIRYKRFNHLEGPTVVLPRGDVLSLRYENGTVEIINPLPPGGAGGPGTAGAGGQTPGGALDPSLGPPSALQTLLNALPPVTVMGNSLQFLFGGDVWLTRLNGRNFSRGTIEFVETADGGRLTLNQTHIYPGAIGDTAGRIANLIPGGEQVGSVLSAAGNIAEAVGPIESSGSIVLDYHAGPPASLSFVSASGGAAGEEGGSGERRADIRKNWILGEIAVTGFGARYERMLGRKISLLTHVYWNWVVNEFYYDFAADIGIRWYPWGKRFFLGTALGYHHLWHENTSPQPDSSRYYINGIGIPLEWGWKFDPGRDGAFYLETGASVSFITGYETGFRGNEKEAFLQYWRRDFSYRLYFGMGGSW